MLVARALPAGLGAAAKCKCYSLTGPNIAWAGCRADYRSGVVDGVNRYSELLARPIPRPHRHVYEPGRRPGDRRLRRRAHYPRMHPDVNGGCSGAPEAGGNRIRRVIMITRILFLFSIFFVQAELSAPAEPKPLSELDSFLQNVRKHLHSNWMVQSQYTYIEKTIVQQPDSGGKSTKTETKVYEVYPSADEQFTYKKLISEDDIPAGARATSKGNGDRDKKLREWQVRREQEDSNHKRRREEKEREAKRKEDESLDEVFRLYKITIIGRERIEGVPVIGLLFEPRPAYEPKTEGGKILKKVHGKAWFSEEDHEYVRIEAELNDGLSLGLGFIVRLDKGTRMIFQRRKIDNEVWLPVISHFVGTGRILFVKSLRIDKEIAYSDYRKISPLFIDRP
jgi:hypothetical protein